MKIVIMNTVPYGSTGRIARSISEMARARGHEVSLVFGWTKKKRRAADDREIIATGLASKLLHLLLSKLTGLDGCFSALATRRLIRRLERIQPDIIHLHIMHDSFLHLPLLFQYIEKRKIRVIWTFHDGWTLTGGCPYYSISRCDGWQTGCQACGNRQYDRLHLNAPGRMWQLKRRIAAYDRLWVTAPSQWLADQAAMSAWRDKACFVLRNGVDLQTFHRVESDFRQRTHCENKRIVLGVAFDWGCRKGLDVFNALAGLLPENYQIILVGTNAEIDRCLDARILSIHKTENQGELAQIYSAADVFVNPTREEAFGLVNIEAIACGTPVITFDTDGAPEGVNPDSGIVVKERTAQGLLPHIREVCERPSFVPEKMQQWVRRFDEKVCYQAYIDLYEKMMQREWA
ncbi:MAG: glycosyltransferase [Aristaeellaceae bacterium]